MFVVTEFDNEVYVGDVNNAFFLCLGSKRPELAQMNISSSKGKQALPVGFYAHGNLETLSIVGGPSFEFAAYLDIDILNQVLPRYKISLKDIKFEWGGENEIGVLLYDGNDVLFAVVCRLHISSNEDLLNQVFNVVQCPHCYILQSLLPHIHHCDECGSPLFDQFNMIQRCDTETKAQDVKIMEPAMPYMPSPPKVQQKMVF